MDSTDLTQMERRARRKYELARAWQAFWGFSPSLVVVAVAALASKHPTSAVLLGSGMFVLGLGLLWYGREMRRAVLPGLAMGILPLSLALCANHMGHMCMGDGCMTLCVPACTIGGLGAGIGVSVIGRREGRGLGFLVAVSALTVLTGAMGCACVGYAGVAGLMLGYAAGVLPAILRRALFRT